MYRETKAAAGLLLVTIGVIFYCQAVVFYPFFSPHRNDFKHLYIAGYLAERGGDFYDPEMVKKVKDAFHLPYGVNPFVYPPFFALLLIPLSRLGYDGAWTLFFVLSQAAYLASLALIVRLIAQEDDPPIFWWGVLLSLSACFHPLVSNFEAGQMNTFLLLAITGSAYALHKKRDLLAGILIGLGTAVKVSPVVFLFYFLWKKQWKAAAAVAAVTLISLLISLWYLGTAVHFSFLREAAQMGYGSSTWAQFGQHYHVEPHNQAPSALWYRLLTHNPSTQGVIDSPATAKTLSILTALLFLFLAARVTRRTPTSFSLWEYSVWCISILLLPSLLWYHYFVQAMPAIAVSLRMALSGGQRRLFVLALGLAFLAVPLPYYLDFPIFKSGVGTLVMSVKLYGLLMILGFFLGNREEEELAISVPK